MEITILNQKELTIPNTKKVTLLKIEPPIEITNHSLFIGIDPGTANLGVAMVDCVLEVPYALLFQISMERNPSQIDRMINARILMFDLFGNWNDVLKLTIEGSNFAGYRQTELAEIRAAIALWGYDMYGVKAEFVPPQSIRKQVFGTAKINAHEYWENLKKFPDAAAALSCALYSMKEN